MYTIISAYLTFMTVALFAQYPSVAPKVNLMTTGGGRVRYNPVRTCLGPSKPCYISLTPMCDLVRARPSLYAVPVSRN